MGDIGRTATPKSWAVSHSGDIELRRMFPTPTNWINPSPTPAGSIRNGRARGCKKRNCDLCGLNTRPSDNWMIEVGTSV